jgi:hypothetical protein
MTPLSRSTVIGSRDKVEKEEFSTDSFLWEKSSRLLGKQINLVSGEVRFF